MKKFEVYKNIRKRALILGLPISLFALMMIAIIASLLIIIFSFGLVIIICVILANTLLYIGLTKFSQNPQWLHIAKVFPKSISNKKTSALYYE
jgi:type IV secretory pathway VirB3-like protein